MGFYFVSKIFNLNLIWKLITETLPENLISTSCISADVPLLVHWNPVSRTCLLCAVIWTIARHTDVLKWFSTFLVGVWQFIWLSGWTSFDPRLYYFVLYVLFLFFFSNLGRIRDLVIEQLNILMKQEFFLLRTVSECEIFMSTFLTSSYSVLYLGFNIVLYITRTRFQVTI